MAGFTVGTYDFGKDNEANLLAAINAEHGTTYTVAEYRFTKPERVTVPTPIYNTKIKLGPLAATGKIGFKTIYYNRIHAKELGTLRITWQNEAFLTELLPRLSEKYGIALTSDDVYEQVIVPPVAPEKEVSITLNFKEGSVAYYGGDQIILGSTDPAVEFETPQTLPFRNDLVFFVNNFTKTKDNTNFHTASTVSIASDKIRFRSMDVTDLDTSAFTSLLKNTYTDAEVTKLNQYLPFTFSWFFQDTKIVRGVNIYGDIVEVNETSNIVKRIGHLANGNPSSKSELTLMRSKIVIREGTQSDNGVIYIIAANITNNAVDLYRSADFGDNFVKVTLTKTNMATFNYANFADVVIHDMMVFGNKLSVLVTNPNTYGTDPIKRENGPAVEEFNLDTGACSYYPINALHTSNTKVSLVFNSQSKLRFVSPSTSQAILDVVGVARSSNTLEPVLVYCHREPNVEYTTELLPARYLDKPIFGISAWSKPLQKDSGGIVVAVELLTIVPTATKDDNFIASTNFVGENSYVGYGFSVSTCIRKKEKVGGWHENLVSLGKGSSPTSVTLTNHGKRRHYAFSGGNGIFTLSYTETSPGNFVPSLETVFATGSHSGFNVECDISNGTYVAPDVFENVQFAAVYNDLPDEESLKLPIAYSFLATSKVTNTSVWLTASDAVSKLAEREFGAEYGHLGKRPAAVFTDATAKLYAWTKYQGIYVSKDQGNSWTDFSAATAGYENDKYLGKAVLDFRQDDFKSMQTLGNITYAEIKQSRDLKVMNLETFTENFDLKLKDKVIYRIDATKPNGATVINSSFMTTALNNTSEFSPRNVVGWDTDNANNIRVLSLYNEAGVEKVLNQLDIPTAIEKDVFDSYLDVGFLDLKAMALTYSDTAGYNLHTVRKNDSTKRHGLRLSTSPEYANFEPVAIQPLWDGNDNAISYTPILILSKNADVLVFERESTGYYTLSTQTITIPGDNTKPIQWVQMFSSNRHDRVLFQEDNGIFKLKYSWDGAAGKSKITLVKMFDTATLNIKSIQSGCEYNLANVNPFGEATIGPWPARDTKLGQECRGYDLYFKLADGFGGNYWQLQERNNVATCNFVKPAQGNVGQGGGNINVGP